MCEMESDSNITSYVYSRMLAEVDHEMCERTWLYDHLSKYGFFENQRDEFRTEILRIFNWLAEEGDSEPKIGDIQSEYLSNIYNEIELTGQVLNVSRQEIFDTYDLYCSQNNYSIEDEIKEVLDEQGLSLLYFKAPEDDYALVVSYFGAQTFFPDILNHLVRRRAF